MFDWKKVYDKYNNGDYDVIYIKADGQDMEFKVQRYLTMQEAEELADMVCNNVIDREAGKYHPEFKDFYLRVAVISTYTDIMLPETFEDLWKFVYGTPIFAMIASNDYSPVDFRDQEFDGRRIIDVEQYNRIVEGVNKRVEYEAAQLGKAS